MTTPREDAIAALRAQVETLRGASNDYGWWNALDAVLAILANYPNVATDDAMAALGAEAETPDPQRRWHRCEYPGCGLWHDSRDEVTP